MKMEEQAERRREKRVRRALELRRKNEPPQLSWKEEVINAVTHGVGAALAVAALVLLICKAKGPREVAASCVYGISILMMMLMSCVYHAMRTGSRAKRLLRRFDYSSIYLLIGGTFAPILLVYYGTPASVAMFWVQWAVILVGVVLLAVFGPGFCRPLHFTLYFLIGWSGLVFLPSFYRNAPQLLWWILAGGLVYTLGMIPFARNRKYDHCVWHVLVLLAAFLHWFGLYTCIPWQEKATLFL